MERAGTKTKYNQGSKPKSGLIEAEPVTKISLTKKKLAKTAKRMTMIYPTGLFR